MAVPSVTLRQLRYLSELAATGHFRRAAQRLGITQPSLSVQIASLEETLGVQLVERGATVVLTPVGRSVLERAQRILADVQGLTDAAQTDKAGLSGILRIGVSPTLGPYLMPHIVARLHREHQALKLHVREGSPDELVRELGAGLHDVVLAQLPVGGDAYVVRRLFREPVMVAMASDDPLAAHPVIDPRALAGRELLTLSTSYKMSHQTAALAEAVGATVLLHYEGTSLDAIRQMAGMGMGLALLPALYVRSEIRQNDDVVVRTIRGRPMHRDLGMVWRKSAGRIVAYRALCDLVISVWEERAGR